MEHKWYIYIPEEGHWPIDYYGDDPKEARRVCIWPGPGASGCRLIRASKEIPLINPFGRKQTAIFARNESWRLCGAGRSTCRPGVLISLTGAKKTFMKQKKALLDILRQFVSMAKPDLSRAEKNVIDIALVALDGEYEMRLDSRDLGISFKNMKNGGELWQFKSASRRIAQWSSVWPPKKLRMLPKSGPNTNRKVNGLLREFLGTLPVDAQRDLVKAICFRRMTGR